MLTLKLIPLSALFALILVLSACSRGNPMACVSPKGVPGEHSGISFSGGKIVASMIDIQTQCLPVVNRAMAEKDPKQEALVDFEIAVTVKVQAKIQDEAWLRDLQRYPFRESTDTITLDAITENGVVIASGTAQYKLVPVALEDVRNVNATIYGLTPAKMAVIRTVRANWNYSTE